MGSSGSVAVKKEKQGGLELIAVEGVDQIRLFAPGSSYPAGDVRQRIAEIASANKVTVAAFKADGTSVGAAQATKQGEVWTITPVTDALRYIVSR